MSGVQYRLLEPGGLPAFIALRQQQLLEEGAVPDTDLSVPLADYYRRHLADGTFVAWLAVDGQAIVATSGMSFVEKPPYYGNPSGRIGLLSSMYTLEPYRRRGIAKELLGLVVDEARTYGCGAVHITASEMGAALYRDFGFRVNANIYCYRL